MTNSDLKKHLADIIGLLSIPGIGRGRYHRLVKEFGSAQAALKASRSKLEKVSGISRALADEVKTKYDPESARQMAARVIQLGWTVRLFAEDGFPRRLTNIPEADFPPVLFTQGDTDFEAPAIAIVGTRHPTEQGKIFTYNLAKALAEAGITVVSGMADGVDAAAHKGALDAGGKTVAVWGSSLDIVYPPSNKKLAERIKTSGSVVSEYLPGTSPERAHFPERNRIISGLSDGVVVVEAGRKSGALITSEQALSQGRELFAVPGQPGSKMSEGTNDLIKKGARLLTSIDDIFDELPRLKGVVLTKKFTQLPDMTDIEKKIVDQFSTGPQQIDQLGRILRLPVTDLMEVLLALELKGVVRELSGKRFILSEEYV
ncbi:MAG: DNA-processing protein DprA [Candidatus Zixiibacteriota bacterium]